MPSRLPATAFTRTLGSPPILTSSSIRLWRFGHTASRIGATPTSDIRVTVRDV